MTGINLALELNDWLVSMKTICLTVIHSHFDDVVLPTHCSPSTVSSLTAKFLLSLTGLHLIRLN